MDVISEQVRVRAVQLLAALSEQYDRRLNFACTFIGWAFSQSMAGMVPSASR